MFRSIVQKKGGLSVGNRTEIVMVVPYEAQWKIEFEKIKTMINQCIGTSFLKLNM